MPLAMAVESIWIYSGYRPPHFFERVLPSGTVEMIVQLRDEPFRCYDPKTFSLRQTLRGPLIVGARAELQVIDTKQQLDVMGVHFRPGGIRSLFSMPADELAGLDLPIDSIWRGFGPELHERLSRAVTPEGKMAAMASILATRMRAENRPHPAVSAALRRIEEDEGSLRMGRLTNELGLSSRRFIEVFSSHVGLSPKSYYRLRRFQKVLRAIHEGKQSNWADIACEGGWYDQAHMIRDFKEFSGLTPSEYERLNGDFLLHVPIEERGQICPIPAVASVP